MCGRFAFYSPHEAVVRLFGLPDDTPEIEARYNIAPTTFIPAVRELPDDTSPDIAATRRLAMLYWGLVPVWAKEKSIGARMTNARAETLREKPAFRNAYRKRRALVPADGYYEWMQLGPRDKQPYFLRPASGGPFALAALWEAWRDPATGEPLESCTLITTAPPKSIAYIHDRMPVIIPAAAFAEWLDPRNQDVERLDRLLSADGAGEMVAQRVSRLVSNARNQGPQLIEPVEEPPQSMRLDLAPGSDDDRRLEAPVVPGCPVAGLQPRATARLSAESRPMQRTPHAGKVFAIGFYKTGTTTLFEALQILGLRTINGDKPGSYPGADDGETLLRQIEARRLSAADVRALRCVHRQSLFPPLARDLRAVSGCEIHPDGARRTALDRELRRFYRNRRIRPMRVWMFGKHANPGDSAESRQAWLDAYRAHNAAVREHFRDRPGQFLEFDPTKVREWGPLTRVPRQARARRPVAACQRDAIGQAMAQRLASGAPLLGMEMATPGDG